ncbi:hypothetical protein AVEN_9414-1 [Araneus ventricosus]|uniref:Integrase catalytic domain-containing protein n=1 Tax=Araneus ventricosus TaxID=182803 RepID=A0A4Y2DMF6_ARAVE|nr:hypothetical protein AVEN_9414-1 [Araneus ventricosus]
MKEKHATFTTQQVGELILVGNFPLLSTRFSHVNVDVIGPQSTVGGMTYLLTCVDRVTRWPDAFPVPDQSADTIALAFWLEWISRFGVPKKVISDRGTNFQSNLFSSLSKFLCAEQTRTNAYHPQNNAALDRFHIHLKSALIFLKTGWTLFRWCYSASERVLKYTNSSPEDYVQYLQTFLEDIHEFARCRVNIAMEKMKIRYNTKAAGH